MPDVHPYLQLVTTVGAPAAVMFLILRSFFAWVTRTMIPKMQEESERERALFRNEMEQERILHRETCRFLAVANSETFQRLHEAILRCPTRKE